MGFKKEKIRGRNNKFDFFERRVSQTVSLKRKIYKEPTNYLNK